jgi:hypothetical protein
MFLHMELVYIFTMKLLFAGIYLSIKSLRKPVNYQLKGYLSVSTFLIYNDMAMFCVN